MTTLDQSISAAVERLKELYPDEYAQINIYINDPIPFAVSVGAGEDNHILRCGNTLEEALERVIKEANARNPEARKQARIAELKKELSELEAI